MRILVTGAAGFIGAALCEALLARGDEVIGIDSLNDYYQVSLKEARRDRLREMGGNRFTFLHLDFSDNAALEEALGGLSFDSIVHLGAQAGVRYSIENPHAYVQANLVGHVNMLELARHREVAHMVYASSSSVYGGNAKLPFVVEDRADHPVSLYAATKKADELMSETYAHLYRVPLTGLRFFTVYGPWGRPDMALWKFTQNILAGKSIPVFNNGDMYRDFTYVDDLVRGIRLLMDAAPVRPNDPSEVEEGDSLSPAAPFRVVNIGNSEKVRLMDFVEAIEDSLGQKAIRNYMDMQKGDVPATWANAELLKRLTGYQPQTNIRDGIEHFVTWFRDHYRK